MLTELLIGLCLSSDQFLNIMRLFGTMAFKASNRIDRGNSETSSSHRLFDYIVYALLGGTIIGRAPVSFWHEAEAEAEAAVLASRPRPQRGLSIPAS